MTAKYKHGDIVPTDILADRLDELAEAVTKGTKAVSREFDMRIPAELDRDADLVMSQAACRMRELERKLAVMREALELIKKYITVCALNYTEISGKVIDAMTKEALGKLKAVDDND